VRVGNGRRFGRRGRVRMSEKRRERHCEYEGDEMENVERGRVTIGIKSGRLGDDFDSSGYKK